MLSIWKSKRFLAYAIGLSIDRFGNAVYLLILPLIVYSLSESVLNMSLMAICQFVPRFICSFFIGAIVDRISRRTVIFSALLFQGTCSIILAMLFEVNLLDVWMLYVFGALISVGFEFSRVAELAVVPVMFGERRVEATSGLATVHTFMFIMGPIIAGVMLPFTSYNVLLWVNAVTYLAPILACIGSKIPHEKDLGGVRSFTSVIKTIGEGFAYLQLNKPIKKLITLLVFTGIATGGVTTIILFHLKDIGMSDTFTSLVVAAGGIGLFVGSTVVSQLKKWERRKFTLASIVLTIIGLLMFILPFKYIFIFANFLFSLGFFSFSVSTDVLIQDLVPNKMLGRIAGLVRMVSHITLPVSTMLLSWIISTLDVTSVFVFSALLVTFSILIATQLFQQKQLHIDEVDQSIG